MLKIYTLLIPALLAASLSGCGMFHNYEVKDADLVDVSYDAVDDLQKRLTRKPAKNSLIIVTTLLNVDNLNKTSAFGRIVSDQIASAFHQAGYQIIGMELPIDLFVMQEDGSLHLSDDTQKLLRRYHAAVLVGGVYAPGKKNSYVSLRVIETATKNIISSTDYSIPMGPDAKLLMSPKDVGSAGTRGEPLAEEVKSAPEPETSVVEESSPAKTATEKTTTEKTSSDSLE
ncbi:MAG: FlgO family outer membrane protein [Methylovulum sp.]|uniref:FlgO family outer membrane protein n=1 Tax=Methylovulum sp. TaxID=1916980 RepID=UPI002632F088|nr:FlgO family outer membrane protein [Methylovulum sp.]MDD2723013.1 FlgO family outer membrane protein [Methylovulum sp.]MDD5125223.1 FlgO family outer membrane protein [Methylovulum sp.]